MPAVIDTRRPRVMRCNPDCPSLILDDTYDNVHAGENFKSNNGQAQSRKLSGETGRRNKHRKRKPKYYKIGMDMQVVTSMGNFCNTEKEVKVRLGYEVTILRTIIINHEHDLVDSEVRRHEVVGDPCLRLQQHQSSLHRLPKSSTVSSQCSHASGTKKRRNSDPEAQQHRLDSEWFVGESDRSFVNYRYKTNSNKIQRWEKRTINNSKRLSYFQFVLLFFLFAFGHSSVTRSSVPGVVTFGTIFCAPTWAAPINSLEATNRSERSANLYSVSGTSRWIRMFVRNRYLQILPDGTVNGTDNDNSIYTILQRHTVATAQLRIKASATCLYLCMDSCGLLYGSSNVTENCIFRENILSNGYNYYTSVSGSGPRKNLLIALNRLGHSRKLKIHNNNFGKRINYGRTLTVSVPPKSMATLRTYIEETLQNQDKIRHARNVRHEYSLQQKFCSSLSGLKGQIKNNPKCRKQEKRRKKKRTPLGCAEHGQHGNSCGSWSSPLSSLESDESSLTSERSCEDTASNVLCNKQLRNTSSKKRKSRIRVSKGDEQSQPRRKDKNQDVLKKSILMGGSKELKKSITIIKQQKTRVRTQTSRDMKENITENVLKATLPPWENFSVTSPTWYTISTSSPTWDDSQIRKSLNYAKNAVTIATKSSTTNHFHFSSKISLESNSSLFSSKFDVSEDPMSSAALSDSSNEDSEEGIYTEDNESTSSIDNVTLMTTMDTTPPERTEDYTKATTQSTFKTFSIEFKRSTNHSN